MKKIVVFIFCMVCLGYMAHGQTLINLPAYACDECPPLLSGLDISGVLLNLNDLYLGEAYTGSVRVSYARGNGITYYQGTPIQSTGITGITAVLREVTLTNNASGELLYDITGTPTGVGTANFQLSFGGQSSNLSLTVDAVPLVVDCSSAKISGNLIQHYFLEGANPVHFEINVSNNSSSIQNFLLNNTDWIYDASDPDFYVFRFNQVLARGSTTVFGFKGHL